MRVAASRNRSWRRWTLFVALQLLVILILAEAATRVVATKHRGLKMLLNASAEVTDFSDVETLEELMDRSMLGFSPFSVEYGFVLNSRSFRTMEYSPGGAHDRLRVVALGDSFTFASGGIPHEDHWTTLTQRDLARRSDRRVEVLRLGVPGTGPAFQLRLWELEAAGLEPDVVVVGFFVGNDFVDHQDEGGVFGGDRSGFGEWLAVKSALFRVTRNLIRVANSGAVLRGNSGDGQPDSPAASGRSLPRYRKSFDPTRPTFDRDRFVEIEARSMALCLRAEETAFAELSDRVAATVLKLASAVEAAGARFIVMVIPDQYQVDDELVDEILKTNGLGRDDYDLDRPQQTLVAALESAGVEVLDLLPVFRSTGRGADLYRPLDTHWNRRGNAVAAEALVDLVIPWNASSSGAIFIDDLEAGDISAWQATGESDSDE